ncbi:PGF-CTERM sorting domain-containing protein [Natrinema mahii]|nr:PGF-CTERM sorting domain-containing protein [Natrinema mahii]
MDSKSDIRATDGFRAFLILSVVAAVALATIGLPVIYGGSTTTAAAAEPTVESYQTASQAGSELGAADDVYLGENGSAVLEYEDEMNDLEQLEVGMDVSEGLAYMLAEGGYEETDEFESGSFSAVLDQDGFSGNGSMVMQQPDDLERLDLDVSGEVSDEANEFDATATGAFTSEDSTPATVESDGQVTMSGDRFETSGSATVSSESQMGTTSDGQALDVSLQERSDGYVLDVTDERTVSSYAASDWETREQAKQTLSEQYASFAMQLGGNADVTIESYDFDETTNRLELEFTIEYTGIDSGIEQALPLMLMNDDTAGLDQAEAEAIATGVTDLEIDTIEMSYEQNGGSMDAQWNVQISNYDELTLAMLDAAESVASEEELEQMNIEQTRAAIEAQQAADLETNMEWDASLEQTAGQELTFDAEASADTENWEAYLDELDSRDVQRPNDVRFDLSAETADGQLSLDGTFEVGGEDLAGQALDTMAQSAQTSPAGTAPETTRYVEALSDANLQVARVDADMSDGTVRLEGGAKFENMSELTDTVTGTMAVSGVSTATSGDTASMYVHVEDMGDVDTASATKADIEQLAVVGDETTVHEAGEWDEEFSEVPTDTMSEYLSTETTETGNETDDGDDDDDSIPGFGPGIALASVAGLLTALLLRQRN